jgi:hypothetical protein
MARATGAPGSLTRGRNHPHVGEVLRTLSSGFRTPTASRRAHKTEGRDGLACRLEARVPLPAERAATTCCTRKDMSFWAGRRWARGVILARRYVRTAAVGHCTRTTRAVRVPTADSVRAYGLPTEPPASPSCDRVLARGLLRPRRHLESSTDKTITSACQSMQVTRPRSTPWSLWRFSRRARSL